MQLRRQRSCSQGLHRSSDLQKAQAIRMTPRWIRDASTLFCKTLMRGTQKRITLRRSLHG